MARPREFDESQVLARACEVFARYGYNGTSIDDLVKVTGLLRGSLYKAFGSKRNLFERVLQETARDFETSSLSLDLLTVALKDLAAEDIRIRKICAEIVGSKASEFSKLLGQNLLSRILKE
ncbi:MAG: hypothetical protein RLZZ122_711 [Actinomycetota bacterium]|jgi:AcrR family transcriptional regulator